METAEQLIDLLAPRAAERVLDVGCGLGEWTARIAERGAIVTGIERLAPLLEQARWKYPNIEFLEADLFDYAPTELFDAVYAHAVMEWLSPPDRAARKVHSLLKPGGRLAACLGGANETARRLDAYYSPSPRAYSRVLERAGFRLETCENRGEHLFVLAWRKN